MATTSPNLGLTLPTPNVDSGWGATLNTDFTLIDDLFLANGSGTSVGIQVGSGKVANVGGTLVAGGTVILGSGDATNTVAAPTIRGTARTGTNAAGANLTIDAANGTGTGGSGKIVFRTAPAGSTGTVANTMQTAMEIANTGIVSAPLGLTVAGIDIATLLPAGTVLPYAGSSAPTNYLLCDGSAVSRASYAALFAIVGTTYGSGDGLLTFNVPDLRGRVPAGKDDMGGNAANRLVNTRTVNISTISRSSTTCTVTTTTEHGLDVGDTVTISGAGNATFNGTWTVATVIKTGAEIARATRAFTFTTPSSGTISSVSGGVLETAISGAVNGASLGAGGGTNTHTLTVGQIANHVHTFDYVTKAGSGDSSVVDFLTNGTGFSTNSQGGSGPHNNVQPTLVLNYIIKT
jgi:microcystin-dependent protein